MRLHVHRRAEEEEEEVIVGGGEADIVAGNCLATDEQKPVVSTRRYANLVPGTMRGNCLTVQLPTLYRRG